MARPLAAGERAVRTLLRCYDGFGLQHLRPCVAAVPVGVDPVLELAALVAGAVLGPDRELGQNVPYGGGNRGAGFGGRDGVGGRGDEQGSDQGRDGGVGEAHDDSSRRSRQFVIFVAAPFCGSPGTGDGCTRSGGKSDGRLFMVAAWDPRVADVPENLIELERVAELERALLAALSGEEYDVGCE